MTCLSLIVAIILFCSSCFSNDTLTKSAGEDFFDYVCRIKQLELSGEEAFSCRAYLKNPSTLLTPYLQTLDGIFREQLALRMGSGEHQASRDLLDKKVAGLMRGFLKDKLGLHKPIHARHDLAQRAKWDPHYHGSSLFADYFPKAKLYLPNYEEAYAYMKLEHRKLQDRTLLIKQAMEADSFAVITEAGSGYDTWHITHADKRIIPILAHWRSLGPVPRHDVLGYDLCGLEEEDGYRSQKEFFQSIQGDKIVRVHVGETIIPASGREHVRLLLDEVEKYYTSSKPLRIGHGTHIGIEDMLRAAKKGYYIEACLTSNKRTGIIDKRSDYPLGIMLLLGVNIVIGTDGGRLYSTTLPEEYAHAARNLEKFHAKLKNSNEPVFLPNGDSLRYKHILGLIHKHQRKIAIKQAEQIITYKQLGAAVDLAVLERINVDTLVLNANKLFKECYPHVQ